MSKFIKVSEDTHKLLMEYVGRHMIACGERLTIDRAIHHAISEALRSHHADKKKKERV